MTSTPKYDQAPVVEVLCGVALEPIHELNEPLLAQFWRENEQRYAQFQVANPLGELPVPGAPTTIWQASARPEMMRWWFQNPNAPWLLQVQPDRLIVNWRTLKGRQHTYEGWRKLFGRFMKDYNLFREFLEKRGIEIQVRGCEVQYVGHEPFGEDHELKRVGDVQQLLPFMSTPRLAHAGEPDAVRWAIRCQPEGFPGQVNIAMHTEISPILESLVYAMTVHTIGAPTEGMDLTEWFEMAHEQCVWAFADLTSLEYQTQRWQRRETGDES